MAVEIGTLIDRPCFLDRTPVDRTTTHLAKDPEVSFSPKQSQRIKKQSRTCCRHYYFCRHRFRSRQHGAELIFVDLLTLLLDFEGEGAFRGFEFEDLVIVPFWKFLGNISSLPGSISFNRLDRDFYPVRMVRREGAGNIGISAVDRSI